MSRKGIALFLSILFMCILIAPNSTMAGQEFETTADHDIRPMWSYINTFRTYFDIVGWGKAESDCTITSFNADELSVEIKLQQWKNDEWVTIKRWYNREEGPATGVTGSWYVMSGYDYRVVTTGIAYVDGEMVEYTVYASDPIEY